MGKTIDILQFIPTGKESAITRETLSFALNIPDREVRKLIAQARRNQPIINLQNGSGYYLPTKKTEVIEFLNQETHRARSIFWSIKGCRDWLKKKGEN